MSRPSPNLILPVGTRVVARKEVHRNGERLCAQGAVGVISQAPTDAAHSYRVRLPDGTTVAFKRSEFSILRSQQEEESGANVLADRDLFEHVIFKCVVGSRAYGLSRDDSDTDLRGVYLAPAELHWSLFGVPEQLEDKERDECYWELQKFLQLALKANPNNLECLWSPMVEHATPLARELLDMREAFLSKLAYQTYNGYVLSQFRKLEQDLRNRGRIKWKHAMHLLRLLLSGIEVLRHGRVLMDVGAQRERLLAIRDGALEWEEVNEWRLQLHREFDEAARITRLPERPDYQRANGFLIRARRFAAGLPSDTA